MRNNKINDHVVLMNMELLVKYLAHKICSIALHTMLFWWFLADLWQANSPSFDLRGQRAEKGGESQADPSVFYRACIP